MSNTTFVNPSDAMLRDDDGYIVLQPKAAGKEAINKIAASRKPSKLTVSPNTVAVIHRPFDTKPMSEMLDRLYPLVNDGKYDKAKEQFKPDVFTAFTTEFTSVEKPNDAMMGMAKKMINIAKSFFEYSDIQLITDKEYDDLLAAFKARGGVEPSGIVPKGSKQVVKTDIKYPTLHNNMDKCYRIGITDPVPDGVKETTAFDEFLTRVYTSIGMDSTFPIAVEISPKIDGVSVNGTVKNNTLMNPQSRGDTNESVAIPGLSGITVSLDAPARDEFGIQYEAFCTEEDRINASKYLNLQTPYVSNRHAAAGIIHRLGSVFDDKLLEFINLYPINTEGLKGSYTDRMNIIQQYGIVPKDMIPRVLFQGNFTEIVNKVKEIFDNYSAMRETKSFAFDGIVITIADDEYQQTIGRDGRTNKYQIALKFNPTAAITSVKGVTLDSGRKGYRTVQVEFEHPVYLDGVKYDHVPVLSSGIFDALRLRKDSKVKVSRVGDVIPSISMESEGTGELIRVPDHCPTCGSKFSVVNGKYYCSNMMCKDNIVGRFLEFFTKLGLDGYGEAFCATLHEDLKCNSLADVLRVKPTDFKAAGVNLEAGATFHDVLVGKLNKLPDYEIIGAMGLPGIGSARARKFLAYIHFNDLANEKYEYSELISTCVRALGKSDGAMRLVDALMTPTIKADIKEIAKYVGNITTNFDDIIRVGHSGADFSSNMYDTLIALGFSATGGKSFDLLIVPTLDHVSAKVDIAKRRGLPIMTEEMFRQRYSKELSEVESAS